MIVCRPLAADRRHVIPDMLLLSLHVYVTLMKNKSYDAEPPQWDVQQTHKHINTQTYTHRHTNHLE